MKCKQQDFYIYPSIHPSIHPSRDRERQRGTERERERFNLRNWLKQFWRLAIQNRQSQCPCSSPKAESCYGTSKSKYSCSKATCQAGEFCLTQGKVSLLFYPGLQLIKWGPPTWWRAICFAQSTDLNVNLSQKNSHRNTQIMFNQMSGHPRAQSHWHIKLTITR